MPMDGRYLKFAGVKLNGMPMEGRSGLLFQTSPQYYVHVINLRFAGAKLNGMPMEGRSGLLFQTSPRYYVHVINLKFAGAKTKTNPGRLYMPTSM
jgi:hypothetical protein